MSYEYDFQDRMESGRQVAIDRRNKGLPSGKPARGWSKRKRPIEDTPENRVFVENADLRRRLRDLENQVASYNLNGAAVDDFGAEFDALVNAGRRLAPPALSSPAIEGPAREPQRDAAMNPKQYLAALKKLRLKPASRDTAKLLGLSVRQCQRYAAGASPIPVTLERLLKHFLAHGLPPADS